MCTSRVCKVAVNGLGRLCGDWARSLGLVGVCEDQARRCSKAQSGNEQAGSGSNATSFALDSGGSNATSGASSAASSPDAALSEGDSCDSYEAVSFAISDGADGSAARQDIWTPRLDCGALVLGKVAPLLSQGQVLVMNLYVNLRRILKSVSCCAGFLGSSGRLQKLLACRSTLGHDSEHGAGQLADMATNFRRTAGGQRRQTEQCSDCNGTETLGVLANASQFALEVRVREAIHIAATGGTSADFVAAAQRIQ